MNRPRRLSSSKLNSFSLQTRNHPVVHKPVYQNRPIITPQIKTQELNIPKAISTISKQELDTINFSTTEFNTERPPILDQFNKRHGHKSSNYNNDQPIRHYQRNQKIKKKKSKKKRLF